MSEGVGSAEVDFPAHQELGTNPGIDPAIGPVDAFEGIVDVCDVAVEQQIAQELVVEAQPHERMQVAIRRDPRAKDLLADILHAAQRIELERVEAGEIPDHPGAPVDAADRTVDAVLIYLLEIAEIGLAIDDAEVDTGADIRMVARGIALRIDCTGGVIEVSTNNGGTWSDVSSLGTAPGYTAALSNGFGNPLGARQVFTGTSPRFPALMLTTLDFGMQFAGQSVLLRFRIGTDTSVAGTGWNIDDIDISGITNTPFPALVPEPSTCTARQAPLEDSALIAVQQAPAISLDAFDRATCVLQDAE